MRTIDWSKPGGIQLTQQDMAWLQQGWQELAQQLACISLDAAAGLPVVLTGMGVGYVGGVVVVAPGWVYYRGQICYFAGDSTTPGAGEVALMTVTVQTATMELPFNDGSNPSVRQTTVLRLSHAATVTDDTHFDVTTMVPWLAKDIGMYGNVADLMGIRAAWTDFSGSLSVTALGGGTVSYVTDYCRYKWNGKTMHVQLSLKNVTITGTVTKLSIQAPPLFYGSGGTWANLASIQHCWYLGASLSFSGLALLQNDGGGNPVIVVELIGSNLPVSAGNKLNFSIVGETT